jgi:5'-deoxynucleotidase YfbR-like HD superfamily hydrolase
MTSRNINTSLSGVPVEVVADELMTLAHVVDRFMDVTRATMRHDRAETDGEHTLRLQFIAVSYAARFHPELNLGKISLYALIHDFVEVYAGDVNSLKADSDVIAQKELTEKAAFGRLEGELGDTWPDLINLLKRYEELEDAEARFVKCLDKCDPSFTHHANGGQALMNMGLIDHGEFKELCERVRIRMAKYAYEFPDVMALREELITRVARTAYTPV